MVLVLTRLPKWLVPLLLAVLLVVGLAVSGPVGLAALIVVLVFVAWLVFLSWPVIAFGARLLRLVVLALVVGALVARLLL